MKSYRVLNITVLIVGLSLVAAIGWLWRGYYVALERDRLAQLDDEGALKFLDLPTSSVKFVTTTKQVKSLEKPNEVTSSVAVATSTKPAIERTAVSPLTGMLVLGEGDVNLDVPYTSQAPERIWDQPWQDACEEASVLMLDAYYRGYGLSTLSAKDELQKMVDWQTARGWGGSIDIAKIKIILQEYYKITRPIRIITNPTVLDIKQAIAAGHPVLAVADGRALPNSYYSNGGPPYHALIIRGYTADKFITNDPGVNRGKNFVFPVQAVMNSLHDWNDGKVTDGLPAVLVIE